MSQQSAAMSSGWTVAYAKGPFIVVAHPSEFIRLTDPDCVGIHCVASALARTIIESYIC